MSYIKCVEKLTKGRTVEHIILDDDRMLPLQIKCSIAYTKNEWWLESIDEVNVIIDGDEVPLPLHSVTTEKQREKFIADVKAHIERASKDIDNEVNDARYEAA